MSFTRRTSTSHARRNVHFHSLVLDGVYEVHPSRRRSMTCKHSLGSPVVPRQPPNSPDKPRPSVHGWLPGLAERPLAVRIAAAGKLSRFWLLFIGLPTLSVLVVQGGIIVEIVQGWRDRESRLAEAGE